MNQKTRSYTRVLLWLSAFIGLGAYWGGAMMFLSPDGTMWGMDPILPYMQHLPFAERLFSDFVFSGLMLILVNGVCNTLTVIGLLRRQRGGVLCGLLSGAMLFCWLTVQWVIFAINPLTTIYTLFAVVQIFLAVSILKAPRV